MENGSADFLMMLCYAAGEIILQIAVILHILSFKCEDSSSAALWIVIVFCFPIVGVILYLVFGVNRMRTTGLNVKIAGDLMKKARSAPCHTEWRNYLSDRDAFIYRGPPESRRSAWSRDILLDRLLPETVPFEGNRLELLTDGNMAYPKMLDAIKRAESTIHLQSFIISDDSFGNEIFDTLEKKAREGVTVRILYDRFGSLKAVASHFFKKYSGRHPNLQILPFTRVPYFAPWRIQLRNHRKLLIADGSRAFVGGINISGGNIASPEAPNPNFIHDLHCGVTGPAVGELQFVFLRDWCYSANIKTPADMLVKEHFPRVKRAGGSVVRVSDSGPGHNYAATERIFLAAAATAAESLWIMSPYFIPERHFIKSLCVTAARGVDVRVIVPANNNHWYARRATNALYPSLLDAGVRVFEKTGHFSHAKAMLVDGDWAFMGSSNCDTRSFRLNYELDFVAFGGGFPDRLRTQFERELSECREITGASLLGKMTHERLLESACSLLTPVL